MQSLPSCAQHGRPDHQEGLEAVGKNAVDDIETLDMPLSRQDKWKARAKGVVFKEPKRFAASVPLCTSLEALGTSNCCAIRLCTVLCACTRSVDPFVAFPMVPWICLLHSFPGQEARGARVISSQGKSFDLEGFQGEHDLNASQKRRDASGLKIV